MVVTPWAPDDEVTAAHLNEMVDGINGLLDGTTSFGRLTVEGDEATDYVVDITNADPTNGRVLALRYGPAPTTLATFQKSGMTICTPDGVPLLRTGRGTEEIVNDSVQITDAHAGPLNQPNSRFVVTEILTNAEPVTTRVMADFSLNITNDTTMIDATPLRAVGYVAAGSHGVRAGEFHVIRRTGADPDGLAVFELSLATQVSTPGLHYQNGMTLDNSDWGLDTGTGPGVRANTAIRIGASNGWENFLDCYADAYATRVFRVNAWTTGNDVAGDVMSAGRLYHEEASGGVTYRVGILNADAAPNGHTWAGMTYQPAQNALYIGALTNSVAYRKLMLDSGGAGVGVAFGPSASVAFPLHVNGAIAAETALTSKELAGLPATPPAGYGAYWVGADNLPKFITDAGAASTILTTSTTLIDTVNLVAHAVTQSGVATTGAADSTGSGTFVSMAGLSVTLTTTGGDLLCFAVGALQHSAATTSNQVGFQLDAAATISGPALHSSPTIGAAVQWANVHLFTGVSAGSHTVTCKWLTGGGTATAYGGRTLVVIELKR